MDRTPILVPRPGPLPELGTGLDPGSPPAEPDALLRRRAGLRRASDTIRVVLREPCPPRLVPAAVARLDEVWARHVSGTESPDGVLEQILTDCPRLAPVIGRLRRQHREVTDALTVVRRRLTEAPEADHATVAAAVVPVLFRVLDVVDRHRREGRRLLHDAYHVDLGLGE
jgi:hypothetical protein